MSARIRPHIPVLLVLVAGVLVGCSSAEEPSSPAAPDGTSESTAADGGASGGDEPQGGPTGCDAMTTEGWELFADERLTIEPADAVVSLQTAGDSISFVDTAPNGYTTYSYSLGYMDDAGTVFPNDAAIFVGAEQTNTFELEGPVAPSGVDGGPYAGVIQIEATDDDGTVPIARICVLLATSD